MEKHFWPVVNAKEMRCFVFARVGARFQLQNMVELEILLRIR